MDIVSKVKRVVLAAALVSGMGMGVSAAYDICDPCVRPVVVRTVKVRKVRRCRTSRCAPRVYRVVEPVVYVERPVEYYEPAPVYRQAAPVVYQSAELPPPPPCSSCR